MENNFYFTSESVSEGHPDKVADQISDALLDAFLSQDEKAHVAVETLVTTGQVVVAGEVRSSAYVDVPKVARETIARIGYTNPDYGFEANSCGILTAIHEQSPDINQGVSRENERKQGAGDQGCIKEGTLITTKRGYVPIEQVVEGDFVLTSKGYRRVYHVQKTGELETITLKTNRGNELSLTPDHLVKTEEGWVEAKDSLGKTLCINKEEDIKTETQNHVFTIQTQSTAKYKGEYLGIGSVDIELDCNLAYLLGLYMGDGSSTFREVYFACSLFDKVEKYKEAIQRCGFEPKRTKVGFMVHSVILYQILEDLGLRQTASEKTIPQLIFQSNKDIQSAFVRGCFDSDGSIVVLKREGKNDSFKVKYGTVSKKLAHGLRLLLLGLGVKSSVCFSAVKGKSHIKKSDGSVIKNNNDMYLVNLRGRDSLIKFSENVGLEVKYKAERLKECLNQTQLVKNINNAETVAEIIKDEVYPVYDISVEGQPEFYADGILVHNCMFGFACDETETFMPAAHYLATLIVKSLAEIRREGKMMQYLRPDSKSQVTIEYDEYGKPKRIDTIVVSTQHDDFASERAMQEQIRYDVKHTLIPYVKSKIKDEKVLKLFGDGIKYYVNPTGKFVIGGPAGDTGLTGRKIIVDTYGGYARHGGGAFCVDGDTEYLSPDGWKKISEYDGGKVAQWDNGELTFVKPLVYHKHKAEKMYHLTTKHFLDMVLSENHNVVLETSKGNIIKKRVKDLVDNYEISNGNAGFIPISFNYAGGEGVNMTDDEIRLQVAFCADGTLKSHSPHMTLKKPYKKERIIDLLELTQTEYGCSEYHNGYMRVRFEPKVKSKSLVECFKGASLHQLKVIAGELKEWDGDCDNVYRTTFKEDADFAQFVFMASSGKYASIRYDERIGETYGGEGQYTRNSVCYEVRQCDCKSTNIRRTGRNNTHYVTVEDFQPSDGMMYCFTVPSTMLVLRRNDRIFVTGNSGKDPSKVDRSAAYAARFIAKNLVNIGLCTKCEIQLGYAIGVAEPVSILVNDFGTYNGEFGDLGEFVRERFDLSPYGIDKMLGGLRKPIYLPTAAYGHFGREPYEKDGLTFFPWEKILSREELLNREKYV